jgi:hypothetical protein
MLSKCVDQKTIEKRFRALLRQAIGEANQLWWHHRSGFDQMKAACLSLFAEISYLYLTEDEYRNRPRTTIVPCYSFQAAMRTWPPFDSASATLREGEIEFEIIATGRFVAVVFYLPHVTIVAVRGTAHLYDWKVNFSILKQWCGYGWIHSGFLREDRPNSRTDCPSALRFRTSSCW